MKHADNMLNLYLLVPTVSYRQHPLFVDEHPPTEVVTIVEGSHVWPRVRLALLSANDSAIFTWNCRCNTHTHARACTRVVE